MSANTYEDKRLITLNSKYGNTQNGTYNSNILFPFRGILKQEDDIVRTEIEVVSAQIPVSFYNINYTNNVFKYKIGIGAIETVTIPVGNYNATKLISALTAGFIANGDGLIITLDSVTGILSIINTLAWTALTANNTMMTCLGFNQVDTAGLANISLVLSNPLNLLGVNLLSINSTLLGVFSYSNITSSKNVLASIPVDSPSFGIISFQNLSNITHKLKSKTIDDIDIQLYDDNGSFINFNAIPWTITLCLTIHRKGGNDLVGSINDLVKPILQIETNLSQLLTPPPPLVAAQEDQTTIGDQSAPPPPDPLSEEPAFLQDPDTDLEQLSYLDPAYLGI